MIQNVVFDNKIGGFVIGEYYQIVRKMSIIKKNVIKDNNNKVVLFFDLYLNYLSSREYFYNIFLKKLKVKKTLIK